VVEDESIYRHLFEVLLEVISDQEES